jgi:hypothetical protein
MSVAVTERSAPRPGLTLVESGPSPRPWFRPKVVLPAIYLVALVYHWLQGRGHVTPAIFSDELFYSKLAQSLAAGDGYTVRGETVFFPSPLPVLLQAPAWLFDSTPTAYAVVKALNAAVMAAAVFPAYALARRLTRPAFAGVVAAAAVAGPPMLYHSYLMSEALAYPVFLLACATMVRAIAQPSRRMELAVVGISVAACLTRVQFVVLPLAYLLAAPLAGRLCGDSFRAALRRHRVSLSLLAVLGALPLLTGGLLVGTYLGIALFDYAPFRVLDWGAFTATLLPFAAGWFVVPGAILGLGALTARPRTRAEAAFGVLAYTLVLGILLQVGLVAAGEAGRSMERYAIYLVPLLFVAFFAYVERGAPHRRTYVALALVLGLTAWLVPFPARAGDSFSFDTPTFSAYAQLAAWWGHANAATVFAAVPLAASIVIALVRLGRRHAALVIGVAGAALLFLSGIPAYAGDHEMTRGTLRERAGSPPDWLDRSGFGRADYLQLPGGSAHYGFVLETWNRSFGRAIELGFRNHDGFASSTAKIDPEGHLLVDGRPPSARVFVLNDFGTQLDLEGTVLARPRDGLSAVRVSGAPRVRSLALGLTFDRWAAALVRYQVWPRPPVREGVYRLTLELPRGVEPRKTTLSVDRGASRTLSLRPGTRRTVEIPARGYPVPVLRIETDHADYVDAGTASARLVAVRISALSYGSRGCLARVKRSAQGGLSGCR